MTRNMKAIRANYLWFLQQHRNTGGPMGCFTAADFVSGDLPLPPNRKQHSAAITLLPLDVTRQPPTALVTSWTLPASLARAREALLPRERAEIGDVMNPRDVCLWFLVLDPGIAKLKDYLSFYVPGGVRDMRDTELSDDQLAARFIRVVHERQARQHAPNS